MPDSPKMRINPFLWVIPYDKAAKASPWLSDEKKNFEFADRSKGFSENP
jgi:hypothetical protein